MSTKTKRWNAAKDGKVLASLFESGLADPRSVKAADIDPIKGMRKEFKDFTDQQFRSNYKTTATNWMAGKAIEGVRLKSLNCELRSGRHVIPSLDYQLTFFFYSISFKQSTPKKKKSYKRNKTKKKWRTKTPKNLLLILKTLSP